MADLARFTPFLLREILDPLLVSMVMVSNFSNFPDKFRENDKLREYKLSGSDYLKYLVLVQYICRNNIYVALVDSGGHHLHRPPPNEIQFFHFCIRFCQKTPASELGAPLNRSTSPPPPHGKCWIRYWLEYLPLALIKARSH